MKRLLYAAIPTLLMGLTLWGSLNMPKEVEFMESALSPELPLGYTLTGWYGIRTQESAEERQVLAPDTRFSKGAYTMLRDNPFAPPNPILTVSLIYSGNDMTHSIHRPEGCLPAQGHLSLRATSKTIRLDDGQELTFTRLASLKPDEKNPREFVHYIHYYVFVGSRSVLHNHFARLFTDVCDRITSGRVQRWAYCQVGGRWGGSTGHSEAEAEAHLHELIAQLVPELIDWKAVGR